MSHLLLGVLTVYLMSNVRSYLVLVLELRRGKYSDVLLVVCDSDTKKR